MSFEHIVLSKARLQDSSYNYSVLIVLTKSHLYIELFPHNKIEVFTVIIIIIINVKIRLVEVTFPNFSPTILIK